MKQTSDEVLGHEHLAVMMRIYAAMEHGNVGMSIDELSGEARGILTDEGSGVIDLVRRSGWVEMKRYGAVDKISLVSEGVRVARRMFDVWENSRPPIQLDRSKIQLRDVLKNFTAPPKWGVTGKDALILKFKWLFRWKWL